MRTGLVLGLLLALAAAGCGGADDGDGVATAGGRASSSASASPAAAQMTDEERQVKFAQCMRDQGVDMPDPEINEGRFKMTLPQGADQQEVQAAMAKCKQYMPNGGEARQANPQQLERMRKLSQCMREHGVPEFPDPDPNGRMMLRASPGSKLNPDDPTFKAAQEACAQYRPAGPGGTTTGSNG